MQTKRSGRLNVRERVTGMVSYRKRFALGLGLLAVLSAAVPADDDKDKDKDKPAAESPEKQIPAPLAPFEYIIGSWKGPGVYSINKIRGWEETHSWAWKFAKGVPIGLTVTMEGDKVLAKGFLSYDDEAKTYTLAGEDPQGKPLKFTGTLAKSGNRLNLEREGKTAEGAKQAIEIFPNGNFVRYSFKVTTQEPGSPRFKPSIDTSVTKAGSALADGEAGGSSLPKCIITGGASTLTVVYKGKTYPLCCTGCRDEFNENPEKYIKKASMVVEIPAKEADSAKEKAMPVAEESSKTEPTEKVVENEPDESPTDKPKAPEKTKAPLDDDAKANNLYKLGLNLDKASKNQAALSYYRRVIKEFPKSAAAKTAAERIKIVEKR